MVLRKVDVEQGLTEYLSQRNIEQYDLLGYYDDELIAVITMDGCFFMEEEK